MNFKFASVSKFKRVFELLELSFPTTEIRERQGQKRLFGNKNYHIIMDEDNDSLIAYWDFKDFIYVEHFAVDPQKRGNGHGARMLKTFLSGLNKHVILEVELPENEMANRRITFYENMGFILNNYSYIQPPLRKDKKQIKLKIMSYPNKITNEEFNNYKQTLYKFVYELKK